VLSRNKLTDLRIKRRPNQTLTMSRLHRCWLAACLTCTLIATSDAQGACYPQFYDDVTTACVADCTVLIPSRLNYASDNDECVDVCPLGTYESGGTCVSACVGERSYVNLTDNGAGSCVADCRNLSPPRFNIVSHLNRNECGDACDPNSGYPFNDNGTCASSCPTDRPYIYADAVCVGDCNTLNPPRINPVEGQYYCVDDCSDSHHNIDGGACVDSCPSQRPYVNASNGEEYGTCVTDCRLLNPPRLNYQRSRCVDQCTYSYYDIDEGACVDSCPSQRSYVNLPSDGGSYGTCVTDCRLLNPPRLNYQRSRCVDQCTYSYYDIDEGACVDSCPSQRPYINRSMGEYEYGTCVADCRLLNPARMNAPMAYPYPECVDDCDSHYHIDEGSCVYSCPSQRPYINRSMEGSYGTCVADCRLLNPARINAWIKGSLQCVDDCSDSRYAVDEGSCVDVCPSQRPYFNSYVDIHGSALHPIRCEANCSALSPPRVVGLNPYRMECRDNCDETDSWEYAGNCTYTCPEALPWASTGAHSDDIPRRCVASCSELVPPRVRSSDAFNVCVTGCRYTYEHIDAGVCVAQCPTERPYFTDDTWECTASCDELDPPRVLSVEGTLCLTGCHSGQYLNLGVCVTQCPIERPYFANDTRECASDCGDLDPPRILSADGTLCVVSCPSQHYVLTGKCSYRCEGSNWYEDEVSGTCVADCRDLVPPRFNTVNSTSPIRRRCEDACLSGFNLNGECVTTCPSGYTADIGASRCVNACGAHCISCESDTTCSSCEASVGTLYYAQGGVCSETCVSGTLKLIRHYVGMCVVDCPDGTHQEGQDRCESCHASCQTCTDLTATSCTSCNVKTRHLTLDGRCELHLAPGGLCDSTKYPSSQDCAYACRDGVCCAAPVPWCTQCAIGTGTCSGCEAGKPLRNGLCGTLIGEDVFNFTAPPATGPPSTLWTMAEDDDRGPVLASGAVLRCVWGSIAWAVVHSLATTL
jgi:hypothetical protein